MSHLASHGVRFLSLLAGLGCMSTLPRASAGSVALWLPPPRCWGMLPIGRRQSLASQPDGRRPAHPTPGRPPATTPTAIAATGATVAALRPSAARVHTLPLALPAETGPNGQRINLPN
ncbi:uncharacterized protein V1510DRAFT_322094 [Dipodascopsis tothii]|uniref:uncharacterized protein n=1 Tax=Dipodascopsis tothii TaxID=44089 RepID=UPI0034CF0F05